MAFDPATGELFVGDAGQNLMEEIDIVEGANNYGWSIREGTLCFNAEDFDRPLDDCEYVGPFLDPLMDPILTYTHPGSVVEGESEVHGTAVIGGRVYRGTAFPDLDGMYIFGDWSRNPDAPQGQLFVALRSGDSWSLESMQIAGGEGDHLGMYVRGFGQDLDGEVYVLTSGRPGPVGDSGAVWRLAPTE
jgi:glucose/arabinose dehydrogenase